MLLSAIACSDTPTPTTPTAVTPTVASLTVSGGATAFTAVGQTAALAAIVTLSNGSTEDRTVSATWQTDNAAIATVTPLGVVTSQGEGDATITATIGQTRGTRAVAVRLPRPPAPVANRTADPPAGQRLPLPADIQATIFRLAAARPDLLTQQSCPRGLKYVTNPWLDYMVDELRKIDTRWGYNAKPNRTAADNSGVPVVVAGDEITYHFGAGADEGSVDVYPIDILLGHCGPTPGVTFRVFTGEEPVRWTGAGRF